MAAAIMNYTWKPLSNFCAGLQTTFEILGYSRAASRLASLGYYEEAKNCMMEIKKLKESE